MCLDSYQEEFVHMFHNCDEFALQVEAVFIAFTQKNPDDVDDDSLLLWFFSRFSFNPNNQEWTEVIMH